MARAAATASPCQQAGNAGNSAKAVVLQVLHRRAPLQTERWPPESHRVDCQGDGEHSNREVEVGAVDRQGGHTPWQHAQLVVQRYVVRGRI